MRLGYNTQQFIITFYNDRNALAKKVDSQADQIDFLIKQKDELESMLIKIQESLIDNMSILGSTLFDTKINPPKKTKKDE